MSLNPIKWLDWLITEHWSSGILRERLGQAHDRIDALERQRQEEAASHKAETTRLQKAHAAEISKLKYNHFQEMGELAMKYSRGEGIFIPKSILEDEERKKHEKQDA